jgi:ATP-binding cassette subfamily B protein
LDFLPWKKNALVWHSWGWKSTIIKLILRLFDYQKWEILIDWQDLKNLKIETLYKSIWYLPQDPAIFDWTIRENLEYAFKDNKKYNDEVLLEALKKARIYDMVKKSKDQLESEIWEKWIKLSGWEKQRLAIARIFLRKPDIIILDEPTSALDSISESKITKTLEELLKWKTSIIIAHRLQTIMKSDKIIVIEEWKIEAQWNHKELIEKSKTYKKLVSLQNSIIE